MSSRRPAPAQPSGTPAGAPPPVRLVTWRAASGPRASLTPALRRYWLAVLPHLEPEDRERLEAILRRAAPAAPDPGRSGNSGA